MLNLYLEDFEMHCYSKGNLSNTTLKQVLGDSREEEELGWTAWTAGLGAAEPAHGPDRRHAQLLQPAHRPRSQQDCPLQALILCGKHSAQPLLTHEA